VAQKAERQSGARKWGSMRREVDVLKIEEKAESENDSGRWKCESSNGLHRLLPVRGGEEDQSHRQQRHD
jgi:hypothetical protein